jgi:hypothetical protein
MIEQSRVSALDALNSIWDKMKGESQKVIETTIDEAVRAVKGKEKQTLSLIFLSTRFRS